MASVAGCGIRRPLAPPDALIFRPLLNFIVATAPVSCANATTSALVRLNIQVWPVHLCARLVAQLGTRSSRQSLAWLLVDGQCMFLDSSCCQRRHKAQILGRAPELASGCKALAIILGISASVKGTRPRRM